MDQSVSFTGIDGSGSEDPDLTQTKPHVSGTLVQAAGGAELRVPASADAGESGAGWPTHTQQWTENLRHSQETNIFYIQHQLC
jgi:hypothetical protein